MLNMRYVRMCCTSMSRMSLSVMASLIVSLNMPSSFLAAALYAAFPLMALSTTFCVFSIIPPRLSPKRPRASL